MPSIQDLQVRISVLEDKIDFILRTIQIQAAQPTGLMAPDGSPQLRIVRGSLLDFYYEAQNVKLKEFDAEMARRRFTGEVSGTDAVPAQGVSNGEPESLHSGTATENEHPSVQLTDSD